MIIFILYIYRGNYNLLKNLCILDELCNDADDDVQELDYNLSECTDMPSTLVIDNSSIASPSMIHTESNKSEDTNTGQIQEKFEAYCWRKRKSENISS